MEEMREMREMAENLGRNKRKKEDTPSLHLGIAIIAVVCLVIIAILFSRSCGKTEPEKADPVSDRLEKMEQNLLKYANLEQKISQLEQQTALLQKTTTKLEGSSTSLRQELEGINRELGTLKNRLSPSEKTEAPAPAPAPSKSTAAKSAATPDTRFHEVQKGETLFGIAAKYGLSVKELRALNSLSADQNIQPGQKLQVK